MSTHDPSIPNRQLTLPAEVLHLIVKQLARSDLVSCLTVSYVFYDLATSFIYKTLVVDVHNNNTFWAMSEKNRIDRLVKGKLRPLKVAPKPLPPVPTSPANDNATPIPNPTPPVDADSDVDPLTSRFYHTTHLTIETHPDCFDLPPVHMPNLHTLRVRPQGGKAACLDLCWSKRPWPSKPCTCAILTHLRPTKLILGSGATGLYGTASGLWGAGGQAFPPPFVKEIVLYVGGDQCREDPKFLANLPDSLDRLTLVTQGTRVVWDGGEWWRPGAQVRAFFKQIAVPCGGNAKIVEVAAMEHLVAPRLRDQKGAGIEEARRRFRDEIKAALVHRGMESAEAAKKTEDIQFISRAEFAERERGDELQYGR